MGVGFECGRTTAGIRSLGSTSRELFWKGDGIELDRNVEQGSAPAQRLLASWSASLDMITEGEKEQALVECPF